MEFRVPKPTFIIAADAAEAKAARDSLGQRWQVRREVQWAG
jgi:hypothetical protein